MKTNNGKRLLVAVAVLALIACAFVAFVPTAESDATEATGVDAIPAAGITGEGEYYIPAGDSAVAFTVNATDADVIIYVENGAEITPTITAANSVTLYTYDGEVTPVTNESSTTYSLMYNEYSGVVITGTATAAVSVDNDEFTGGTGLTFAATANGALVTETVGTTITYYNYLVLDDKEVQFDGAATLKIDVASGVEMTPITFTVSEGTLAAASESTTQTFTADNTIVLTDIVIDATSAAETLTITAADADPDTLTFTEGVLKSGKVAVTEGKVTMTVLPITGDQYYTGYAYDASLTAGNALYADAPVDASNNLTNNARVYGNPVMPTGTVMMTANQNFAFKSGSFGAVTLGYGESSIAVNRTSADTTTGFEVTATATGSVMSIKGNYTGSVTSSNVITIDGPVVVGAESTISAPITFASGGSLTFTGDCSGNITVYGTTDDGTITFDKAYNGTVSYIYTDSSSDDFTSSATLAVTDAATSASIAFSAGSMKITGVPTYSGKFTPTGGSETDLMVGSNVVINGLTATYTDNGSATSGIAAKKFIVNGVAFGEMDLESNVDVGSSSDAGNAVVLQNVTFRFDSGKITLANTDSELFVLGTLRCAEGQTATGKITVTAGTVYATNNAMVDLYLNSGKTSVALGDASTAVKIDISDSDFVTKLQDANGMNVVLTNTTGKSSLDITENLEITGTKITFDGTNPFIINIGTGKEAGQRATVTFNDVEIDSSDNAGYSIKVAAGSELNINDSKLFLVVTSQEGAELNVDNADVTYDNDASEVKVGFGTTLNFSGTTTSKVSVYGNLVFSTNATVPSQTITVYNGGSMTVAVGATLQVNGTAVFNPGSKVTVDGTMIVGTYNDGGAKITANGEFVISESGKVTITGVQNDNPLKNSISAGTGTYVADINGTGYDNAFVVYGTLEMNGTMAGKYLNMGTISINGAANSATVVLYDGVALNVTFVSGTLTVNDEGALNSNARAGVALSNGNSVTLNDVTNVNLSLAVEQINWSVDGENYRGFYTIMSISGDVGAVKAANGGSISIDTSSPAIGKDKEYSAYTVVPAEAALSFGIKVSLSIDGALTVDGDINFVRAATAVNGVTDDKKMNGFGTLTVNGMVTATSGVVDVDKINAVKYTITVTGATNTVTDYYTNFADAVAAAATADRYTVTVLGNVDADVTTTIAAGTIVSMENNSYLTVGSDATITLATGATMNGGATVTIKVDGTFTAQNADENMNVKNVIADVIAVEGTAKTWTSLANAIGMGMTEITLNGPVTIDEDLTIPEGTTVTTNIAPENEESYVITVDDATLTVDGTLGMGTSSNGKIAVVGEDGELVVNGVFYANVYDDDYVNPDVNNLDGAHFAIASGASTMYYVSNVEFAAETASENENLVGAVILKGSIATTDVAFTAADGVPMYINIVAISSNPDDMTVVSMGTMTLSGEVIVSIGNNTRVSGNIAAPCGDGTANATVNLVNVSSIETNAFNIASEIDEAAVETEYYLDIYGTYTGTVSIAAGTVTVDKSVTIVEDSFMSVANGAELYIPNGSVLIVNDNEDGATVTVDGTLTVEEDAPFDNSGEVLVNGTMNADSFTLTTTLRITGVLNIAADERLTINGGTLFVGAQPDTLGATGAVNGVVNIRVGGIVAYYGTDMSGAQIDINSATGESGAASTVYYINGVEYATIYTSVNSTLINVINTVDGPIELTGYDTPSPLYWYASEDDAAAAQNALTGINDYVGSEEAVYAVFDISGVVGKVSVGQGITMFIDGLTIDNYKSLTDDLQIVYILDVGTHTVSISANVGYSVDNATITFNGQTVQNGGTITITAEMLSFTLATSGATAADIGGGSGSTSGSDDGLGLTDYLLIVLVILIVIMAIMVALRLMRS